MDVCFETERERGRERKKMKNAEENEVLPYINGKIRNNDLDGGSRGIDAGTRYGDTPVKKACRDARHRRLLCPRVTIAPPVSSRVGHILGAVVLFIGPLR